MKTLDDVVIRLEMMNTLAASMEDAIDAAITASDMSPEALKVQHLFYILLEQINQAKEEANEVAGHIQVCNAILAADRVRAMQRELEELRAAKG